MPSAYLYAVCQQGQYQSVKIGFTSLLTVEAYLHTSYSRSLPTLQIILVQPTSNARLSEAMVHHALAPYRLHDRHELFDLSTSLTPLFEARDAALALDQKADLPMPPDRPFCMDRWHLSRAAAREGGKVQTRLKQAAQAEALRQERERMRQEREKQVQREKAEGAERLKREEQHSYIGENDALGGLIEESCKLHVNSCVATTDFLEAYRTATSEQISNKRLKTMMGHRGFRSTTARVAGRPNATSVFKGVSL